MLNVGDPAPDFTAATDQGAQISLKDLRGKQVVLYFYAKDNTSDCTKEACAFRDTLGAFEMKNAVVLGVSVDPVKSHQRFKEKYGLPFGLVSDEDKVVVQSYGVWKEKQNYGHTYMGIERTTFIIDEGGRIATIFRSVKVNGHVQAVLEALQAQPNSAI
jgi:peroxiredoxin Q/BCP